MTTTTPTTAVDQVKSAFDFSVDKFPLRGPDSMSTPWYGLFDSNGEPVGPRSVSQVYVPHTTDDVVALVEASADAFGSELTARCHFNYGHFVELAPSKDFRRSVFGTADNIFPRVVIRAGYDGRAFSATVGYWRDACNNMAMLRQVDGATVSIRHTSGLRDEMDDLIQTFQRLRGSWDNVADVVANLENRRVRRERSTATGDEPSRSCGGSCANDSRRVAPTLAAPSWSAPGKRSTRCKATRSTTRTDAANRRTFRGRCSPRTTRASSGPNRLS